MSIGLLINTCKHYFTNIPKIIKNIEEYNFPKENILIVSGQENENSVYYENNIKIVKVDYTGLHLTGVIYIYENIDTFKHIKYWIMLPDTITIGNLFYSNIMKYYNNYLENKEVCSFPFVNPKKRPTMDMGIVNINHIINMGNYLNKIKKSRPYNKDDLLQLKKQLIYDENLIFGLPAAIPSFSTKFHFKNNPNPRIFITNEISLLEKKCSLNNKAINVVYFRNLDIYKYQRNFNGLNKSLIMEL